MEADFSIYELTYFTSLVTVLVLIRGVARPVLLFLSLSRVSPGNEAGSSQRLDTQLPSNQE